MHAVAAHGSSDYASPASPRAEPQRYSDGFRHPLGGDTSLIYDAQISRDARALADRLSASHQQPARDAAAAARRDPGSAAAARAVPLLHSPTLLHRLLNPLTVGSMSVPLVPDAVKGSGELPADAGFGWIIEQCPVRGAFAVVMGYGMGLMFGLMFAGLAVSQPHLEPFSGVMEEPKKVPILKQLTDGVREMRTRSVSTAKSFALVGGVYATVECGLEKVRGVKDMRNAIGSGFVTGALLAVRGGPHAMALGGAGFAAFSGVMELMIPYVFE